jgi:PII-like signaling protein
MKTEEEDKVVTIFINSTDKWHGLPLYSAIIQTCQQKGIAGACAVRCFEGYGAGGHLHTTRLLELSENLPIRIEIVDRAEKINPLLIELQTMIGEGLITVTNAHIIRLAKDAKK